MKNCDNFCVKCNKETPHEFGFRYSLKCMICKTTNPPTRPETLPKTKPAEIATGPICGVCGAEILADEHTSRAALVNMRKLNLCKKHYEERMNR